MKITPEIKNELKQIMWDYSVSDDVLCDVFEGKTATFSLNKEKLYARLLLSVKWYKLLSFIGVNGLKEMLTDDVIHLIRIKDMREKFIYARDTLYGIS